MSDDGVLDIGRKGGMSLAKQVRIFINIICLLLIIHYLF
jgi:hypothetical protein